MTPASEENFQSRSTNEGKRVQDIAENVLEGAGFEISGRNQVIPKAGATVNFVAMDKAGSAWHFDVSGAFTSGRPGLARTDTLWKTLGRTNVLSSIGYDRVVLLTTNLPKAGTVGAVAMVAAAHTYFDAVEMLSADGKARLREYARGNRHVPLPGFRSLTNLYPSLLQKETQLGLRLQVPLSELDAGKLPARRLQYKVTVMPHRLKVFIPSKTSTGAPIASARRAAAGKRIIEVLCSFAGGCTGMEAFGSWIDPLSGVMHEQIHTVEAFASEPFGEDLVGEVVGLLVDKLSQHTAALVIDDSMLLLTPEG